MVVTWAHRARSHQSYRPYFPHTVDRRAPEVFRALVFGPKKPDTWKLTVAAINSYYDITHMGSGTSSRRCADTMYNQHDTTTPSGWNARRRKEASHGKLSFPSYENAAVCAALLTAIGVPTHGVYKCPNTARSGNRHWHMTSKAQPDHADMAATLLIMSTDSTCIAPDTDIR